MSVKVESVDDQSKVDEVVMDPISSILEPPENISGGTFVSRVYLAVGRRYIASMRRSVQGIVLYEADRCLSDKYDALKPFQRKAALLGTAKDLVNSLSFIPLHQRNEILFRTVAGKLFLSPEVAWRRMKLIHRDINKNMIPIVNMVIKGCKSHDELCTEILQYTYIQNSGKIDQPYSDTWEYTHMHYFLAFRMYYVGRTINIDMPPACDGVLANDDPFENEMEIQYPSLMGKRNARDEKKDAPVEYIDLDDNVIESNVIESTEMFVEGVEVRRAILKEVKDHLDLLKEFEGLVPAHELKKQRVDLFMSLPSIPVLQLD